MKQIIRMEVQATPSIDMFGEPTFAYRIYQITDGVQVNLASGFKSTVNEAHKTAYHELLRFI